MRATFPRLVRVITRSQLTAENALANVLRPLPVPLGADHVKSSLIESLLERKASMEDDYPSNIRIEPVVNKATFEGVSAETRQELKELLKER